MTVLTPRIAAELAKEVYFVQNESTLPFFWHALNYQHQ